MSALAIIEGETARDFIFRKWKGVPEVYVLDVEPKEWVTQLELKIPFGWEGSSVKQRNVFARDGKNRRHYLGMVTPLIFDDGSWGVIRVPDVVNNVIDATDIRARSPQQAAEELLDMWPRQRLMSLW